MSSAFIGFPLTPKSLGMIARLNDDQYATILSTVNQAQAFDRSLTRCEEIAGRLGDEFKVRDIFNLLTGLKFLYDNVRDWGDQGKDIEAGLREFFQLAELGQELGEPEGKGYQRLAELLSPKPSIEVRRKIQWLQNGILETAVDFASFLDLRPRLSDDRGQIEEFVPIIILSVVVRSFGEEENAYAFQMSTKGVARLRAILDDIDKKVAAASSDPAFTGRLHLHTTDDQEEDE